jgi:hypothetical protein
VTTCRARKLSNAQRDVIVGLAKRRWRVFASPLRGQFEFCVKPWDDDRYSLDPRTVLALEKRGLLGRLAPIKAKQGRRSFVLEQEFVLTTEGIDAASQPAPAQPEGSVKG